MSSQSYSQAGKFKPRKQISKKSTQQNDNDVPRIEKSTTSTDSSGVHTITTSGRSRDKSPVSKGQGRGRGDRGRGRSRGRFVQPKGEVFFTASSTASDNQKMNTKNTTTAKSNAIKSNQDDNEMRSNKEVIFMPGMSKSTATYPRNGEEEEIIVGETEEGQGVGDLQKNKQSSLGMGRILDRMLSVDNPPGTLEDEDEEAIFSHSYNAADFTYESDSSSDVEPKRSTKKVNTTKSQLKDQRASDPLLPQQLPIPPTKCPGVDKIDYLYECQIPKDSIKDNSDDIALDDLPHESPFLDLKKATSEERLEEQSSWMLFKLPTRLPRLSPHSTTRGEIAVKNEYTMDIDDEPKPEAISSSSQPITLSQNPTSTLNGISESPGYDDTLKDCVAGRYGKIVVHKSGKAYLFVGNEDDPRNPPVRMKLSNGLTCGFLQQAVSIDTKEGYVPLGEVKKSIVVTPDVESAFMSGR